VDDLRLVIGASCLAIGAILAIASESLYPIVGMILGLAGGAAVFGIAAGSGRIRTTPGVSWRDQWRTNASGPAGWAAAAGVGISTFLAAALSVVAPHSEEVVGTVLLGLAAGFLLSLRFSRYGKSRVAM
jgi:hypothetical protein